MSFKIYPPLNWIENSKETKKIDVYELITRKYKDKDILFKVIKKGGKIKELTKENCNNLSLNLANQIINIANKNSYYVKDIIKVFEKVLQLKINTSYLKKGCSYDIDISKINFLIKEYNMETIEYIEKLTEKYYKN